MPLPQVLNTPPDTGIVGTPVLISAARTTDQSVDLTNLTGAGVTVMVNISVNAGAAGSITCNIRRKDPVSGLYHLILASAVLTTVALQVPLRVYPGIAIVANQTASDVVPHDWNIQVVANNANPVTYSVSASIIP